MQPACTCTGRLRLAQRQDIAIVHAHSDRPVHGVAYETRQPVKTGNLGQITYGKYVKMNKEHVFNNYVKTTQKCEKEIVAIFVDMPTACLSICNVVKENTAWSSKALSVA